MSLSDYTKRAAIATALLPLVTKHGGLVFGGIVRDFYIRGQNFKDMDIMFHDKTKANAFSTELLASPLYKVTPVVYESKGKAQFDGTLFFKKSHFDYPFQHVILAVVEKATNITLWVDIVLATAFPVDDFDCNQVSWDGVNFTSHCTKPTADLVADIKDGRATMVKGYEHVAAKYLDVFLANRILKLMNKGFTVLGAPKEDVDLATYAHTRDLQHCKRMLKEQAAVLTADQQWIINAVTAQCTPEQIAAIKAILKPTPTLPLPTETA